MDLDRAYKEFQRILGRHPVLVVGTGASCALDPRFGMEALAAELRREIKPAPGAEASQWQQALHSLDAGTGLETAMAKVVEKELVERIVVTTGDFVASVDREWAWCVATGGKPAPLACLLKKLVDGLPPTDPVQNVITPNYDLIIEHTCDGQEVPWADGFSTGITCRRDWEAAGNSMLTMRREPVGRRYDNVTRRRPHVILHKVHGSINWFQDTADERLLRCDVTSYERAPEGWRRAMITPGGSKYEAVAGKRDWFSEADTAINEASAFLLVGYGFNDDHIHNGIRKRLVDQGCSGLVVTRDWTPKIEKLVRASSDLWVVCKCPEEGKKGSMIVGPNNRDAPLVYVDRDLWDIKIFVDEVT